MTHPGQQERFPGDFSMWRWQGRQVSSVVLKPQVVDLERLPASWKRVKDSLCNGAGPYGAISGQTAPPMSSTCFLSVEKLYQGINLIREVKKCGHKGK